MDPPDLLPSNIGSNSDITNNNNQQSLSPSDHYSTITSLVSVSNTEHNNPSISLSTSNQDQSHQNQIVEYGSNLSFQDLLQQAKNVYKNQITESTRLQYLSANTGFVIFLFHNYRSYILQPYLDQYKEWYDNESTKNFSKNIKDSLQMNSICPFDLDLVKTDVFLTYLLSLKREDGTFFSFSCYDGKRSAFTHLITQSGNQQDNKDKEEMAKMMKGLRKTIAKEMSEKGLRVIEGKEHMSFKCYQQTCQLFIEDGSPDSVFALCFLTMQWNLISRSEATESIFFSQMIWSNDHLKIYFPKHKSDQIGLNKEEARHIYSNPQDPAVCPIRALASYLLVFPDIFVEANKLFPGNDQKKRFNQCLHRVMHNNIHIYQTLFVDVDEIGSHSIRKGAATYCCAGVHPGPPIVSVCLRAGWTIGRVKERYLKYENAGDELVGRTLTGIPPTSCEFGISPVYFTSSETFTNPLCSAVMLNTLRAHSPSFSPCACLSPFNSHN